MCVVTVTAFSAVRLENLVAQPRTPELTMEHFVFSQQLTVIIIHLIAGNNECLRIDCFAFHFSLIPRSFTDHNRNMDCDLRYAMIYWNGKEAVRRATCDVRDCRETAELSQSHMAENTRGKVFSTAAT